MNTDIKTLEELIIDLSNKGIPNEEASAIIQSFINSPTIRLVSGHYIKVFMDDIYNVLNPDGSILSEGVLTSLEKLLISLIVNDQMTIIDLKTTSSKQSEVVVKTEESLDPSVK